MKSKKNNAKSYRLKDRREIFVKWAINKY